MRPTIILLVLLLAVSAVAQDEAPAPPPPPPCSDPEFSQFDFWLGTWLVRAEGRIAGHNIIRKISGNCTVIETYHAALNTFEGTSMNWYDQREKKWHQLWTDSAGTILDLEGEFKNGSMVMQGERFVRGKKTIDRITWTPDSDDSVRQHWQQSTDRGQTWVSVFDGRYTRVDE